MDARRGLRRRSWTTGAQPRRAVMAGDAGAEGALVGSRGIHQPTRWLRAALDAWLELGGNLALALLDAPAQVRYPPGEGSG